MDRVERNEAVVRRVFEEVPSARNVDVYAVSRRERPNEELAGPRRRDYEDSRRGPGVVGETAWLVDPGLDGVRLEVAEVGDVRRFRRGLAAAEPRSRLVRERSAEE